MLKGTEALAAAAVETILGTPPKRVERLVAGHGVWNVELPDRLVVAKSGLIEMLAIEAWAYGRAKDAGVPVPDVLGKTESDETGRGWLVLSKARGTALSKVPRLDDRGALLREVGSTLRRLHQVSGAGYGHPGASRNDLPPHAPHATWHAACVMRVESCLSRLRSKEVVNADLESDVRRAVERDEDVLRDCTRPAIVHGDFVPRHIFVDADADSIVAVLDFGGLLFGDPAYDLAVFSILAMPYLPEVIDGYDPAAETRENLDRKIRLYRLVRRLDEVKWRHQAGAPIDVALRRLQKAAG
jgi:aminoglycoside phosphotransferase (APT) family kinase protein